MFKDINAAEALGVGANKLNTEFSDRQISSITFANLRDGRFEPYFPSQDIQDRFREIADDLGDVNVFPEVAPILREMSEEFRELELDGAFDINLSDYLLEDIGVAPIPQQVAYCHTYCSTSTTRGTTKRVDRYSTCIIISGRANYSSKE
jgi:hypothetical protein